MLWRRHTDEFSLILLLDRKSGEDILNLRKSLAPSPFRDDPPHVTLLYARSRKKKSDKELLSEISELLKNHGLPKLFVSKVTNFDAKYYGVCSAVEMRVSDELTRLRTMLRTELERTGYRVTRNIHHRLPLHATLRLGVELPAEVLADANEKFPPGRGIGLHGWGLNRLISHHGKRRFYEIDNGLNK